ncbi:MAG: hypothetical protein L7V86_01340 [Verrucomicrobiales bacterium]|jgi:hypothetical protein|nr:hypothetical protein [Verrucomicrobiales bacterium]MDB4772761.1 hypothetical protein [Verrucomicrobiales bacterium]MDF1784536.1 hypothetical protein [Verrucomicrobiales bacterium]
MQRRHFIRIAAPAVALASCDKPAEHSSNEELVIEGRDLPLGGPKVEPVPRHDYQEPEAFDLNTVSSATYKPLKGTSFELVTDNGRTTPITLHEVRDLPVYPRPDGKHALRRPPFRLIFEASHSASAPLEQGSYTVASASLQSHSLFLVPIDIGEGKCYLEAILN